ncbi:hypothetical protein CDCA_CDCA11G3250 [Cyanidium caldarium]|uniref:Uncharacterized protein n=1 Tax=Cyanidium caldarium TaxID=2771 RepID=A0AAV9IYR1_CYACA|nr:hypothetical protein CDCA_CDCA11G3250 [Cyanidium caldarium]
MRAHGASNHGGDVQKHGLLAEVSALRTSLEASRADARQLLLALDEERRASAEARRYFDAQLGRLSEQLAQLGRALHESETVVGRQRAQAAALERQWEQQRRRASLLHHEMTRYRARAERGERAAAALADAEKLVQGVNERYAQLQRTMEALTMGLAAYAMVPDAFDERGPVESTMEASDERCVRLEQQVERLQASVHAAEARFRRADAERQRLAADREMQRVLLEEQQRAHASAMSALEEKYRLSKRMLSVLSLQRFERAAASISGGAPDDTAMAVPTAAADPDTTPPAAIALDITPSSSSSSSSMS